MMKNKSIMMAASIVVGLTLAGTSSASRADTAAQVADTSGSITVVSTLGAGHGAPFGWVIFSIQDVTDYLAWEGLHLIKRDGSYTFSGLNGTHTFDVAGLTTVPKVDLSKCASGHATVTFRYSPENGTDAIVYCS